MEGREREPKCPYVFHTARVKHLAERTAKSDKYEGNSKGVKAIKVMDSNGSGAYTQSLSTTYLYPSAKYMRGEPWVKGMRKCGLVVGRNRESILGFLLKLLWGEMPCWDDISPKRSKYELEPLDACHKNR